MTFTIILCLTLSLIHYTLAKGLTESSVVAMSKTVTDYMLDITTSVVTEDTLVLDAVKSYLEYESHIIIVTDATRKRLVGIITPTDLIKEIRSNTESSNLKTGNLKAIVNAEFISRAVDTLMLDAMDIMGRRGIHTLVITRGFEPVGLITQHSIVQWWFEEYGVR